jgi:RNA polymerase sigma-70 factor (ECF subfamily)
VLPSHGAGVVLPTVAEGGLLRGRAGGVTDLRLSVMPPGPTAMDPAHPDLAEAAWSEFHERLRAFVARRVRSAADAEDIVQQVFLRMQRSLATLRGADSVGAWLYQTARNAVVDHYRTPSRRREVPLGDTREIDTRRVWLGREGEDDAASATCAAQCLRPLMERLPEAHRRAVEMVELQGMTQLRASTAEGLSLSGMKARVQRGRRRLKAMLLERCRVALDARGAPAECECRSVAAHAPRPGGPCCVAATPDS